ncbi:MAG: filamentous hemagglutinin N-terminal domain-containing protein [Xenococcaceae cyanobacterium MO_188.B32]|nr:filamentous hemagglutinin N-terminal domain-containing protein [Xenococcaceae cyanobacterium MO_188.B32]
MSRDWQAWLGKFTLAIALGGVTVTCWESMVLAQQIIPDETLGAESSVVTPDNIKGLESERISGGAVRGSNLFHSFREFNIGEGRGGYFENPAVIENIFSRVTGSNPSEILGTLGVLGNANLFFLNPNGILFGPNASLDVRGSFLATTADSIVFPDGNQFSATNPEVPPLLTVKVKPPIGLQFEGTEKAISNQGNLVVKEDLTLSAGNLDLQGQLQTGKDLALQATDTVKIRDSATQPFIAAAGGQLLVQGNQSIDIFALNHPDSGLFSSRDMVLRSANPVGGDAHYWTGGSFRIEQLDGRLGNLFSPYDPVIRASGDVSFNSYTGASLHILAGGSVTIPGTVTITEPDAVANSIQERVTLSDSATVVDIDGSAEPTLDIRAGTTAFGTPGITSSTAGFSEVPSTGATETSADISIGSITNNGGVVFLTNQYQPNSALFGGITIGSIDTSSDLGGGSVAIDSRDVITVNGLINVSGTSDNPLNFNVSGDGGDVTLLANGDITFVPESGLFSFGLLGGNITLKSGADISATSAIINSFSFTPLADLTGGNIKVMAKSLSITNGADLITVTIGKANAGSVIIQASELVSVDGGGFSLGSQVASAGVGNAGNVKIETGHLLVRNGGQIGSGTLGEGDAGDLTVKAQSVELIGESADGLLGSGLFVQTLSSATGDGGNLLIDTERLLVRDGAEVSASTFGEGDAGDLTVEAQSVELIGVSPTGPFPSGLFGQIGPKATGDGGNLTINTDSLRVENGADISIGNFGEGNGGNLTIRAQKIVVTGVNPRNGSSSGLAAEAEASGDGGNLTISTDSLRVENGAQISAGTFGEGNGGTLEVRAQVIVVTGVNPIKAGFTSGLFTQTDGAGDAGSLIVNTQRLLLSDEAVISAGSIGNGKSRDISITANSIEVLNGGEIKVSSPSPNNPDANINIFADSVTLDNGGSIRATATNSQGGDININLSERLLLRRNSSISATSGSEDIDGNGGNIAIDAPFIIAFPNENSDITANAFAGDGGNITINANGIFGIEPRDEETPLSDITASSEFGQQGEVEINTSGIDPTRSLNNLPQETVEAEVAQGCQTVGGRSTLEFFDVGRGGLPPSPDDLFSSEIVIAEWIPLALADEKIQAPTSEKSFTGDEIKDMTLLTTFLCQSNEMN